MKKYIILATFLLISYCPGESNVSDNKKIEQHTYPAPIAVINPINEDIYFASIQQGNVFCYSISRKKIIWSLKPIETWSNEIYRFKDPIITHFELRNDATTGKLLIYIRYSNSQFGIIDLETGATQMSGQD
jgi:hypothetical protein